MKGIPMTALHLTLTAREIDVLEMAQVVRIVAWDIEPEYPKHYYELAKLLMDEAEPDVPFQVGLGDVRALSEACQEAYPRLSAESKSVLDGILATLEDREESYAPVQGGTHDR